MSEREEKVYESFPTLLVTPEAGGAIDYIATAVTTSHGRLVLHIKRPNGDLLRLDCLDMDRAARPEYDNWRSQ